MLKPKTESSVAEAIARDGVAHVPGVIDPAACAELIAAIEHCRAHPGPNFRTLSPEGRPVVQSDLFRWRDVPAIRALAREGALPRLAAEVFGTDEVILLEDQWFFSEEGSGTPSPFTNAHHSTSGSATEPAMSSVLAARLSPPAVRSGGTEAVTVTAREAPVTLCEISEKTR